MKSTRSKLWGKRGLVSLALIIAFASAIPAQAGSLAEKTPPGFRDGEWVANFSMYSTSATEVTKTKTTYSGKMGLISAGGQVNGEWTLTGTANYTGDITGIALFDGGGKISGTSTEPVISTSKFIVDMALNVAGVKTQQTVDMGSGGNMPLTLISSTCNQVIADIEAPTNNAYSQAGMTGYASGSFVATRVDGLYEGNSVDYQYQVGELLDQAEALKQTAVAGGGIDFAALNSLVSTAENLQTAIKKNTECGETGDKQFLTMITKIVSDLAYFALSKPELFTTGELNRLVMAALGVGAMGSGAANPEMGADLLAKFSQEFSDRLNDAEANKNCMEATQIKLAGLALNNTSLKQQADEVMIAVC
jgi:hypothetical protein